MYLDAFNGKKQQAIDFYFWLRGNIAVVLTSGKEMDIKMEKHRKKQWKEAYKKRSKQFPNKK